MLFRSVFAALDKRDKMPADAFAELVEKLGLSQSQQQTLVEMGEAKGPDGFKRIEELLADDERGTDHCRSLRRVFDFLDAMGVAPYCTYDMGVVRGLAYYTGMVFEAFGLGGLRRAICGGGRYDRLLSDLGGPPMGGVGFATSDVVIQDVLAELGKLPETDEESEFFIIDADPSVFDCVLGIVGQLRARSEEHTSELQSH